MKAIVRNTYGSPDVLELQETAKPDLTDDGVLVRAPVIERRYESSEVPEALRYLGEGHAQGKIVITV